MAELDAQLAELTAERDELKERMLRMAAEQENFKKRTERDKAEFLKRANESLVKEMLPVLDNLERALGHATEEPSSTLAEGVALVLKEMTKTLERHGLEPVEALGQPFDPERHEAIMQQEDPDVEENTVLMEMQKGYLFQGRLLRPAMVVVSKRPASSDDEGVEVEITFH
ncbi:MAG: nucleotide exchange factor GrpE [Deltaproteobacteria bacterium]|nr:nucleotide exchange factor GrpE [Deltaproteobacteria bacterium]